MRLYAARERRSIRRNVGWLLLFFCLTALIVFEIFRADQNGQAEQLAAAEQAVRTAAATCYALEGSYPSALSYLKEHYGLIVDEERYVISYNPLGGNVMPYIEVVPKGGAGALTQE